VLRNEQERTIRQSLFIHCVQCLLGVFGVFKADESAISGFHGIFVELNLSRLDFSVFCKHCGKSFVVSANWEVLDKEVSELVMRTIVKSAGRLGLVEEHLELFTTKSEMLFVGFEARQSISG